MDNRSIYDDVPINDGESEWDEYDEDIPDHPIGCDCRECEPEPVDDEERYIHQD